MLHDRSWLFPISTSLYQICNTDSIFGTFSKGRDQFQYTLCVLMETMYLCTPKLLIDREDTFCNIFLYFTCVSDEKMKGLSVFPPWIVQMQAYCDKINVFERASSRHNLDNATNFLSCLLFPFPHSNANARYPNTLKCKGCKIMSYMPLLKSFKMSMQNQKRRDK